MDQKSKDESIKPNTLEDVYCSITLFNHILIILNRFVLQIYLMFMK
jgi:hypothetical protein